MTSASSVKSAKPSFATKQLIALILGNLLMILIIAWILNSFVLSAFGNRSDFYPRWVGGRAVWAGRNPYSAQVTQEIQVGMFGSPLPADTDQHGFVYPAYVALILAPLLLLPAQTAIALWAGFQFVALMWVPILWLRIVGWSLSGIRLLVLLLTVLFVYRYPVVTVMIAQFTGSMLLLFTLALILLFRGHDTLAGIILVPAMMPPTFAAPLALLLLGSYALRGRWRGLITFLAIMSVLMLISFVQIGWWIPDFLARVQDYAHYATAISALQFIPFEFLRYLLVITVGGIWLFALLRHPENPSGKLAYFFVSIITCLLYIPQTGEYLFVFLIPLMISALALSRRLPPMIRTLIWLSIGIALVSPWYYLSIRATLRWVDTLTLTLHVGATWAAAYLLSLRKETARRNLSAKQFPIESVDTAST